MASEVDQVVRISSIVFDARRDCAGGAGPVVLLVPGCCVDDAGCAGADVGAPNRPGPDVVVGAAAVVEVDAGACEEAAPGPPKREGAAVAVLAGCEVAGGAPRLGKSDGAAVAVVAAGIALELRPPRENPVNPVAGAPDVAGVPACAVLVLRVAPVGSNRFEVAPPGVVPLEAVCCPPMLLKSPPCEGAVVAPDWPIPPGWNRFDPEDPLD